MRISNPETQLHKHAPVDYSKKFVPEGFTPLFYTPIYRELTDDQRRRYNQLHGCYCNEQIMFLEMAVARNVLGGLFLRKPSSPMALRLRSFLEEEKRHTIMLRELNRRCLPALYEKTDFYFLAVPGWLEILLSAATRRPFLFPFFVWLMLLEEERAVFFGREILRCKNDLEPHFVAVHRLHMADEVGHVQWDEEILDWLWPSAKPQVRKANAALLRWVIDEFFVTPKRANMRVVRELAREFPELDSRLGQIRRAFLALGSHREWNLALHSKTTAPKTLALLERWPEFSSLTARWAGHDHD